MRIGTIKPDTPAVSAAKRLKLHHLRRAAPFSFGHMAMSVNDHYFSY